MLILRFPKDYVDQPIVCQLAKDYDLTFNILKAEVFPRREGMMVMELSGLKKNFKEGVKYLKSWNVKVQNAGQEIKRDEVRCIHCGACTAVCPTGALTVKRPEMIIEFDEQKCSICQLCVPACLTHAMKVRPTNTVFFE
jgi:ferredoxin